MPRAHVLAVNAVVQDDEDGPRLQASWSWPQNSLAEADVRELGAEWFLALQALVEHGRRPGAGGHTPSDFPLAVLSQEDVDQLEAMTPSALEDGLGLTPTQDEMLVHARHSQETSVAYKVQTVFELNGPLDSAALRAALQALMARHPNLRAGFPQLDSGRSVQVIPREVTLPWNEVDLSGLEELQADAASACLAAEDHARYFSPSPPMLRCTLVRLGAGRHHLIMTNHHILYDGPDPAGCRVG